MLQPILSSLTSELRIGYIDDITVGGTLTSVEHDINFIRNSGPSVGLYLNATKCELITTTTPVQTSILSEFIVVKPSNMCLLGAPLFPGTCLNEMLQYKLEEFERLTTNLRSIDAHGALLIIKFSLNTSRIIHLLRCSPCCGHPLLKELGNLQRSNICHIANMDLSDVQWIQASLPVKAGGLGIRRASSLATPAFLASYSSTVALQNIILMCTIGSIGSHYNQCAIDWSTTFSCSLLSELESHKQCTWDKPNVTTDVNYIFQSSQDTQSKARLIAVSAAHSSNWLNALPIASCGFRIDNENIRVAIGLRFGTALCQPHLCPCGAIVEEDGLHGLSCKLGNGKHARHSTLNDLIARALLRADILCVKKPPGLSRKDGKRPDDLSLIPWRTGKSVVWDVTVGNTMALSYIGLSSQRAGSVASTRKEAKYEDISQSHIFVPLVFESIGLVCSQAASFLQEFGRRITLVTGNIRETSFLFQRLSVAIQHFNYVLFKGSFAECSDRDVDV